MFYPEAFKNKLKEAFPTSELLHQQLDSGSISVGEFLKDQKNSTAEEMYNIDSTLGLLTAKEILQEKHVLYTEWCELYSNWCQQYGEELHC